MLSHNVLASEKNRRTPSDRGRQLYAEALPDPSNRILFKCLLNEAQERKLSWEEALEYVVQQRRNRRSAESRCRGG